MDLVRDDFDPLSQLDADVQADCMSFDFSEWKLLVRTLKLT
jgi:hypothetical protein